MKNKKQYITPTLKCVQFKVEKGYYGSESPKQKLTLFQSQDPSEITGDNRFGGYFSGNTDDWD